MCIKLKQSTFWVFGDKKHSQNDFLQIGRDKKGVCLFIVGFIRKILPFYITILLAGTTQEAILSANFPVCFRHPPLNDEVRQFEMHSINCCKCMNISLCLFIFAALYQNSGQNEKLQVGK